MPAFGEVKPGSAATAVEIMEAIARETAGLHGDLRAAMPWSSQDALRTLFQTPVNHVMFLVPCHETRIARIADVVVGFSARSAGRLTMVVGSEDWALLDRVVSPGEFLFATNDRHVFPIITAQYCHVTLRFDGPEMPDVLYAHLAHDPRIALARMPVAVGEYVLVTGRIGTRSKVAALDGTVAVDGKRTSCIDLPDMRRHVWATIPELRRAGRGSEAVRALHREDADHLREVMLALHTTFHRDIAMRVLDEYCENHL